MKTRIYISLVALLGFCQVLMAQTKAGEDRILSTATSAKGNYIYLLGQDELFTKDSLTLKNIDYFIIQKVTYDPKNVDKAESLLKRVGVAKAVSSEKELKNYFSASDIEQMKKNFSLATDKDLVNYFQTHQTVDSYGLYYKLIETRMASGQVFLDKEVTKDEVVVYKVTRVDKDKTEKPWGFAIVQSKVGNYILPYLKPTVKSIEQRDSLLTMTWNVNVSQAITDRLPKPTSKIEFDKDGNVFRMPFPYKDLRAQIHFFSNGKFVDGERMFPVVNATGDTISFTYNKKTKEEEQVSIFLTLEDEIYNQGVASDTTELYAVSEKFAPLIYGINVTDVVDGIHISWKQLPEKPYITGIEIMRYDSQDHLDSLEVLSPRDTVYNDYAIKVGQHYRYAVRPVFLPSMGNLQKIPAQGVGTYSKFSKPVAPHSLVATAEGKNVLLKWEADEKPSFFGYFLYRGTSPKNMSLIQGPIRTKIYLDTAQSLSGRSRYYYAVISQNLRQDTSVYSNITNIRPVRKLNIAPPSEVRFYYANDRLDVRWKDVRVEDNVIESFILQKKRKEDANFTSLKLENSSAVAYTDTIIGPGVTYQYRVASVGDNGEVSVFSDASEFFLEKKPVETINLFYVRTVPEGVEISLPAMTYANRKAYNIYRRNASGGGFEKVSSIKADTFSFTDGKIEPDTVYIYTISIIETDNREGALGKSISVMSNGVAK